MAGRIFWAGDSTVKQNNYTTYPQSGIGQGMRLFIKNEIEIRNHAENGRSTKSFINEQRLAAIYNEITEGDFLFIQFGHNDAKIEDPNRYTSIPEYKENLGKFVNVARNKKAYPVFITPLYRRWFSDGIHLDENVHGEYPDAMKETGKLLDVPVIDLCSMSKEWLQKLGNENSKKYFMNLAPGEYDRYPEGLDDNTHLKYEGAVMFAKLVAKGLYELGDIYRDLLIDPEYLIHDEKNM
ncbi:MAG TPA: rhamnogalacturonan acetylesterase [Clostridiales bacterium]|mgnify:CR=1 FL=1|jgi:lysophospholipase L1-like esterase|nr:rhamnogalacturonan acetylesterase [Clostridiales bacterium]